MPDMVNVPSKGYIPVDMCVANGFAYSLDEEFSYALYRTVKPSRAQSDYGPREWSTTAWSKAPFEDTSSICTLLSGENGTVIRSNLPIEDTVSGEVHYKAMLGTLSGGDLYQYPNDGTYYVLTVEYRLTTVHLVALYSCSFSWQDLSGVD